ncbi:MAG: ion transporter [Cyanobacteria bacterium J06621_8]
MADLVIPSRLSLKETVAFYFADTRTKLGLGLNLAILTLILLSAATVVLQTYPLAPQLQSILGRVDLVILLVFAVEYCLRCWSAENSAKFVFSWFGLIDLIAILPLFLGWLDLQLVLMFPWLRILRIIRFWQTEKQLLSLVNEDAVVFIRIFLTLFTLIFVYAGLIYQVEYQINGDRLKDFFDAFYFVVVTMTTVGYGDVTPLSTAGRVMTVLMIFTGVLFIPWQLSELIGQVVKSSNLVKQECTNCGLARHEPDALFCRRCATRLHPWQKSDTN